MKKLILSLLVMTLALGSCNMANDDDYKNYASDLCSCLGTNAKKVTPEMTRIMVDGADKGKDFETVMTDAISKDPVKGMEGYNAVMKIIGGLTKCNNDLEKKYDDLYSNDTDEEMQVKMLKILKEEKGCDLTYALMKMSANQSK